MFVLNPIDIYDLILTGNMSSRKGLNAACSVHEYTGSFIGQSAHFKMTSVCGHVMTLDFIGICSQNVLSDMICKIVKDLTISTITVFFRKSIKEN